MAWEAKTIPTRIDELANELKYVREYISQLPSNLGSINVDSSGLGRRSASNRVGPVKGIWAFQPIETRRYHEETIATFMGETSPPIFLNACEVRAASQIVRSNTTEDLIPIRQLVTASSQGQILFLTVKDGKTLRLMPGNLNTNGVLVIKDVATDFIPDEIVTGLTSGATCEVDFIQNDNEPTPLPAGEKKIWFRNLSGSFQSNEDISGSVAGSAKAKNPQTKDTAGNINIAENVDIDENVELLLKWNPNAPIPTSPEGSWIIIGGGDITIIGGGGTGISFPILYPTDDKGDQDGTSTLAIDLSVATAHVTRLKLVEDTNDVGVPITQLISFTNPPIVGESIAFYITVEQDDNGGHTLDFSDTMINVPLIQTGPDKITNIGFITTDGGVTFDSFVFGQTLGDNLGNHIATEDLKMETFDVIGVDVLRYEDPKTAGADGIIGFGVFGSSTDEVPIFSNIFGLLPAGEVLKWNIPESEAGIPRRYQWEVDLEPVMALKVDANRNNVSLDMIGKGTIDNTQGISFRQFDLVAGTAIASIRPFGLEMVYETGFGTGQGSFHGFHVAQSIFAQFEVREFENRSNVNLDMITNNIFDVDQVQFSNIQGFVPTIDHDVRTITGGNQGIEMNIPHGTFSRGFDIWFQNAAETESFLQYSFEDGRFEMFGNTINDTLGIFFSNGTSILDLGDFNMLQTIGIRPGSEDPQTMKWVAKERTGPTSYVDRDIFEITGQENLTGGFKMFTDINMQTQNINNIDVLKFVPDGGSIGNSEYGITADFSDTGFTFNVPLNRNYTFHDNANPIAIFTPNGLQLLANASNLNTSLNPQMGAREFALTGDHTQGTAAMFDGSFRLVSDDVFVRTGGNTINLSTLGAGTGHVIQDEGVVEPTQPNLNFVGAGVDVQDNPGNNSTDILISGGGVGGGYATIQDEGISLPQQTTFNFIGGSVAVTDDPGNLRTNVTIGGVTSFLGFDADDNLRMNNFDILQVKNIDFDDPASNIQGLVGLNFFFGTDGIFSGPTDLLYTTTNRHRFEAGGLNVLDLQGGAVRPIELRFDQLRGRVGSTTQIFRETFGMSFGNPSGGVFQWYGGSSVIASLQDIGSGGSFNVNQMNVGNTLFFSDSGILPGAPGNMSRVGADIQVFTSNGIKNFKDIGSGVGGGVTEDQSPVTWTGIHTFTNSVSMNGPLTSISSPSIFIGDSSGDNVSIIGTIASALQGGSGGLKIDGGTSGIHEFRFGGTGKFLFTNASAAFNETLSMGFNKIINLGEPNPAIGSDAATVNFVLSQGGGGGVSEGQAFVNWTGTHIFNGPFMTVGNSTSDTLTITSRINSSLIPVSSTFNLGDDTRQWNNLFVSGVANIDFLRLGIGSTAREISSSPTATGNTKLMTASAIQTAISGGIPGSGVTEDQATVTWTGNHFFNGGFMAIGDSTGDVLLMTSRISGNLIPTGGSFNIGDASRQWRDLWVTGTGNIDALRLGSGSTVTSITTSSTSNSTTELMTSFAIQNAIAAGGGGGSFVTTNTTQTVTGTKTFTSSASRFSSNLRIDGNLDHNGSRIGFFGTSPTTKRTVNLPGFALFQVAGTLTLLLQTLEAYGMINTNV